MGRRKGRSDLTLLLAAAVATIVIWQLPFGQQVLYPFSMLSIWCHEMGHGLTAILLGGRFAAIEIAADAGSGVATHYSPDGITHGLVAMGGLLGPSIAGGLLILLGTRPRLTAGALYLLGSSMILSTLLLGMASLGMWVIALFGVAIVVTTNFSGQTLRRLFLHFLAVQMSIGVYRQVDYLFMGQAVIGGQVMKSDVSVVAENLFLPTLFWSGFLTAITFGILAACMWKAYGGRRPE